jgi:quercetin dioxygenase-like cupin family protein
VALPHAGLFDVINIRPLGDAPEQDALSTSLIKTDRVQLLHLILRAHTEQPAHRLSDECTVHCLQGEVEVVTPAGTRRLHPGCVLVLPAAEPHSLRARSDSTVLVTLLLDHGDAGHGGGSSRLAATAPS